MPHVMLRKDWQGTFKRSIRNEHGVIIRTLSFNAGEPVGLSADEVSAVAGDIGKALLPVVYSEEFRKFVVIDPKSVDLAASAESAEQVAGEAEQVTEQEPVIEPEQTADEAAPVKAKKNGKNSEK